MMMIVLCWSVRVIAGIAVVGASIESVVEVVVALRRMLASSLLSSKLVIFLDTRTVSSSQSSESGIARASLSRSARERARFTVDE